jgi:hypothetical protein
MCSLRFENNLLTIEGVRFASISKKTPLSKLSFAFVSLALPLLRCSVNKETLYTVETFSACLIVLPAKAVHLGLHVGVHGSSPPQVVRAGGSVCEAE